jgi:hypothetical protein
MSYNPDPNWTEFFSVPDKSNFTCPHCNKVAGNTDRVMECLFRGDYYTPRHIPSELIFTCDNPDCPNCDEDFTYFLFVAVATTRKWDLAES